MVGVETDEEAREYILKNFPDIPNLAIKAIRDTTEEELLAAMGSIPGSPERKVYN